MKTPFNFKTIQFLILLLVPIWVSASHISGIRISQTGNTGLTLDIDVTLFYTTGSTETTAYMGTYYNQVPAVDWGDGSTVPRYGLGTSTGIPLVATSTVVNGIPARSYRGSFSHTYGSPGNYTVTSNTSCCALTTPTYTLVTGSIQTTTVQTTGPFGPTTFTTSFVQNSLGVDAVAPGFTKAFAPDSIGVNVPSTLTFTIDNTASTLDDNMLDFTDNLPAGMLVATPANAATTCTGGTLTAVSGTGTISFTGGAVAAGSTCTISADVVVTQSGTFNNTSGDLTSAFGNSGSANDTLNGFNSPIFTKSFSPDDLLNVTESTLTFTIDNSANSVEATGLAFTDNMPAGMTVNDPSNAVNNCTGGTLTANIGDGTISYSGGTVAANSSCTITVDITVSGAGDYDNDAGVLSSSLGDSAPASAIDRLIVGFQSISVPTLSFLGFLLLMVVVGLIGLRNKRKLL